MHRTSPKELVDILRSEQLRIRTGILLLSSEFLNYEAEIAIHLGVGHQNICEKILAQQPPNKKLLGINRNYILDVLDVMVKDENISGRCILISGIDLLLAAISHEDVMHFWDFIRDNFRRERGILISIPNVAKILLPMDEINRWNEIERITLWEDFKDVV